MTKKGFPVLSKNI